jgi:hypothetical protein
MIQTNSAVLKWLLPALQLGIVYCILAACTSLESSREPVLPTAAETIKEVEAPEGSIIELYTPMAESRIQADVLSIQVTGEDNNYQFAVEVKSPDQGCDLYADWWEALTEEGDLIYRRILTHSHRDEQPFVRSGGPILIDSEMVILIRAHMHPDGYGGIVLIGSIAEGFNSIYLAPDFAAHLESEDPLPGNCAF